MPLSCCLLPTPFAAGLASSSKSSAQETKQQRKQLENYCHDLLERWVQLAAAVHCIKQPHIVPHC
jgi:hypothetical protein